MRPFEIFLVCHAAFAYALLAYCIWRWKKALGRYDEFRRGLVDAGLWPPREPPAKE